MSDSEALSTATMSLWGKSSKTCSSYLPLFTHLADAAGVAGRLWDEWLSDAVRARICAAVGADVDTCRRFVCWLAGTHDVGKATPAFAWQVPQLRNVVSAHGFDFDRQVEANRRVVPHSVASFVLQSNYLTSVHRWSTIHSDAIAAVAGGHHGITPDDVSVSVARKRGYLMGETPIWLSAQRELLDWMTARTGFDRDLKHVDLILLSQPGQVLLTGLVIVADWIASNEDLFPYGQFATVRDPGTSRLQAAWEELDLPAPWRPMAVPETTELFSRRFALPDHAAPYPIQVAVADEAREMPTPGMLIVEAPMGEGKTEAALAAAEILASRTGASGVGIFLPTRATSDAMFERVLMWQQRLPDQDIGRGAYDTMLAHGKARYTEAYERLNRRGLSSEIGIDEGGADIAVHRWLAGRKRKMLSNFVIGTVDQLLFAALKARHVVLRHLGFAGKVVIIDEAHAYDTYMTEYLDRALEWLAAEGVSVIVLSATLPADRRAALLAAYDNGRLGALRWPRGSALPADGYADVRSDLRYPLISRTGRDRTPVLVPTDASGRQVSVEMRWVDDDPEQLATILASELSDGGCVLVVRNTVRRAEETAHILREHLPDVQVSLAHSRFMAVDRATKDRWLRTTFGPPLVAPIRPRRHIVVATQVAEQSLDIDFDLLVTDLAPVDLVLQRIGRLHRHTRTRPERLRVARCVVTGGTWAPDHAPTPVRGSSLVYGDFPLLRAAAVLAPYLHSGRPLQLPESIAPLVQQAYGQASIEPADWSDAVIAARKAYEIKRDRARQRADTWRLDPVASPGASMMGWLSGAAEDPEKYGEAQGRAQVRDDGGETLDVLLLERRTDGLYTLPWLPEHGGVPVNLDFVPAPGLAKVIAGCTLPLPQMMTQGSRVDDLILALEGRNDMRAWAKDPWVGGELVLDIDEYGNAQVGEWTLHYDRHDGLSVIESR